MGISYSRLWNKLNEQHRTPADLRAKIDVAPNTFTRLRKNEEVSLSVLAKICEELKSDFGDLVQYVPNSKQVAHNFIQINNRRYLGNKFKLVPYIKSLVEEHCPNVKSVLDLFSGTGVVASAFLDRKVITNDLLYSNYITNFAWFAPEPYSLELIQELILKYNELNLSHEENYMTQNFANTYFSKEVCAKIGFIREDVEKKYQKGSINKRERALLITSLLYGMDRIANTCGHYDAYIQRQDYSQFSDLFLSVPNARIDNNPENECYQEDANELVKRVSADLIYIDPPYNSRQYCDSYHLLENVATWKQPEVFGVAKKMDRSHLKSKYCSKSAREALADLIENIQARYILFSYNNMSTKGNDRSNAKIQDQDLIDILSKKGKLEIFTQDYKPFTTGKSNIQDHEERLFLCTVKENK